MKKYVPIYPFQVLLRLEEGKEVYMLDKEKRTVSRVGDMRVIDFMVATNAGDESERYEFWYESEGEDDGTA